MSILSREGAEKLVESGEWRWLTDEETKRLNGLGLDTDGDIDPYSGAAVYITTAYYDKSIDSYVSHRGIISVHEDITRVGIMTFARHPEIWIALTDEQKAASRSYDEKGLNDQSGVTWAEASKEQREEWVRHALESAHKNVGETERAELTIPIRRWKAIKYAAR